MCSLFAPILGRTLTTIVIGVLTVASADPRVAAFVRAPLVRSAAAHPTLPTGAVAPARTSHRTVISRVDSLFNAGAFDSTVALAQRAASLALAAGDTAMAGRLMTAQARAAMTIHGPAAADSLLSRAIKFARAAGDSGGWMNALGFTGIALGWQGDDEGSRRANRERLRLSRLTADRESEGWALTSLAYLSLRIGAVDSARVQYERAAALFAESKRARAQTTALIGLGRAHTLRGSYAKARRCYTDALSFATRGDDWRQQSDALNNLGGLEFRSGDMARAAAAFVRAYELNASRDNTRGTLIPATNVARARAYLGQYGASAEILQRAIDACRRFGFSDRLGMLEATLGNVRAAQGRTASAARHFRRVLGLPGATARQRSDAALGLGRALERADSLMAARGIADSALASGALGEFIPSLHTLAARCERRLGNAAVALVRAERARRAARGLAPSLQMDAELEAGAAHAALGHGADTREAFLRAAALADTIHRASAEYTWRENGGRLRGLVDVAAAAMFGDASSTRRGSVRNTDPLRSFLERDAFNVIQHLKARTLLERALSSRPHAADSLLVALGPVTAHTLQTRVLRPDELLIDITMGDEHALAFAVSPDTVVCWRLPGERSDLPERIDMLVSLAGSPPEAGENGIPRRAVQDVFETLLGPAFPFVKETTRVIIAPDGCTSGVPFALLNVHAMTCSTCPEGASESIYHGVRTEAPEVVPSAALLAWLRHPLNGRVTGHGAATSNGLDSLRTAGGSRRVLLCAREHPHLRGVINEVDALARRCKVTVASTSHDVLSLAQEPEGWSIIHASAHIEVNAERPWRSGVVLDPPATAQAKDAESDSLLRARDIASARINASLAFLSGCESGRGRASAGEGVLGLSSAFLVAGVPAVIATLWPVDDDATAEFVARAYDALARGVTVSRAVAIARQALREQSATRHPFYWAGFVVVGDGGVTVSIAKAVATPARIPIVLVVLALLLGMAWIATRRGIRVRRAREIFRRHHRDTETFRRRL